MNIFNFLNLNNSLSQLSKLTAHTSIVLSVDGGEKVVFPIVPARLPQLDFKQNNEIFNSIIGDMSIIGLMGLRSVKLEGLLPDDVYKYSFCSPSADNATTIINFINRNRQNYTPFRLVISKGSNVYINMQVLVNNFTYSQDNLGDYTYSIDLVEYREYISGKGLQS